MNRTRWGILGPGNIAQNFADGLAQAQSGELMALASRSAERRASFGDRNKVKAEKRHSTYEALLADKDVDAIYISTPHPVACGMGHQGHASGKGRSGRKTSRHECR